MAETEAMTMGKSTSDTFRVFIVWAELTGLGDGWVWKGDKSGQA